MVADPLLAEHGPAKPVGPFLLLTLIAVAVVRVCSILGDVKPVRCRPQADHGLASPQIVVDLLHLLVGQVAKPGGDHHQVSLPQGLEPRDIVPLVGADLARGRIDRVEHRAGEAVVLREDLRQLRERLFAAILLIAAHEHYLLALAGPVAPFDDNPRVIRTGQTSDHEQDEGQKQRAHRGLHSGSDLLAFAGEVSPNGPETCLILLRRPPSGPRFDSCHRRG